MKPLSMLLLCAVLTLPASADVITATTVYDNTADVEAVVIAGRELFFRGDTEHVRLTQVNPPNVVETPYDLWESGVGRGFRAVYNLMGTPAGIGIDDVEAISPGPIPINEETNGLLISAFAPLTGLRVELSNLKLTLPDLTIHDIPVVVDAQSNEQYLIAEVGDEVDLTAGFIVSGTVAFTWDGGTIPAPADQWFEVTPVVVPEPSACLLLLCGLPLLRRR